MLPPRVGVVDLSAAVSGVILGPDWLRAGRAGALRDLGRDLFLVTIPPNQVISNSSLSHIIFRMGQDMLCAM